MPPTTRPRTAIKTRGPVDPDEGLGTKRWWNAPAAKIGEINEVGQLLFQELAAIERSQTRQRFFHYVCALLVDGRAPATFGYSMTANGSRESQAMSNALFRPPSLNCIAVIADVLKEKVWSKVTWLEWLPISKSDFESRSRCTETTEWMHAFFEETDLDGEITQCGVDGTTYGTTIMKTMPSLDGKKVVNTRVLIDEMRVSNDAAFGPPKHEGQVSFESKEDLINVFAKGKNAATIKAAIQKAPSALRSFMALDVNYSDIVCLAEGFRYDLPDDTVGRHILTLPDGFTLVDEPWHESPYTVLKYNKLSRSYTGKGVPENCLGMQMELDRMVACRAEAQRQASYPHVQVDRNSQIDDNEVEGAGIIHFTGTPARFETSKGTPQDIDATIKEMQALIFMREGISQDSAGGQLPAGLDAAVAIQAFSAIDDSRHRSHALNLEKFVEGIGKKNVRVASIVKPKVRIGAKDVAWASVAKDLKKARMRAFPISKMPSTLPAQIETIERWSKAGNINAKQRARLLGLPDTMGQLPMIAASENATSSILDEIIKTGEYLPPDSQCDPQEQYDQARARYLVEMTNKLPRDRLLLLLKFVAASKAALPPPPAAAPGPQPGAAPAPPPQ